MHLLRLFSLLACSLSLIAGNQTIPWIANKDGEWSSQIILNNPGLTSADVTLQAVRADGSSHDATLTLNAGQQQVLIPTQVFSSLGSGSGFSLFISSESSDISAAVRVASLNAASGFSPAMATAVRDEHASNRLIYPVMPIDGFSALVITNLDNQQTHVSITAHTESGVYGAPVELTVEARRPTALLLSTLFPELTDNAYVVVEADGSVVGSNFSFNAELEPSMINAHEAPASQTVIVSPLLTSISTMNAVGEGYTSATEGVYSKVLSKRACPEVTTDIVLNDPETYLTATIDYGDGCTTTSGIHRSGSMELALGRQGSLSTGALLSGSLSLNALTTQYQGNDTTVAGSIHAQGSTLSANFGVNGSLAISGTSSLFQTSGEAILDVMLQGQVGDGFLSFYGVMDVVVETTYAYDVTGTINDAAPLIYTTECPWPTSGIIHITAIQSRRTYTGTLDFGTGDCHTATATINGVTETIDLSDYY